MWKESGVRGGCVEGEGLWLGSDMREWYGREGLLRGCGMEGRDVLNVYV